MITMATLEELREEWAETHDHMAEISEQPRENAAYFQAHADSLEAPFKERLTQLEEIMRPMVTPDTPKEEHGVKIAHRREYNRVVWDGKGLEGFMVAEPRINAFRGVTTVKASTSFSRVEDE